jgi:seryl-tRNA synthetase
MIDIKLLRDNPDAVRENIRKKFQDAKLPLVDEVIRLDQEKRAAIQEVEQLKAARNKLSKENGPLFGRLRKCAESEKAEIQAQIDRNNAAVKQDDERRAALDVRTQELEAKIREIMYTIPNIIDPSVPIGPDDTHNVEVERFGEPVVPDFEIPHHVDIMASFHGIDKDAAGRVAGMGFYYLLGDIARLHEAVLAYARDFMIDQKHFTYVIPPFMMHGDVVRGVMSFPEMDAMMYKIEGEDLYLIGTSEHTMIGRFIDQILPEGELPLTLTSYSPCFRKEVGSHGLEERGVYRIHQFEKQEMIVVCKPEDAMKWYDQLWRYSVELFRSLEIPVRQLECCSGDLADLKVKSCDIEAWSPRQQKYFEVCSCSNLGDAQARRLNIRYRGEDGKLYLANTLNNTCVAPPRMLIAFLENHLQKDGTVTIPACLQPYMGGKAVLVPDQK